MKYSYNKINRTPGPFTQFMAHYRPNDSTFGAKPGQKGISDFDPESGSQSFDSLSISSGKLPLHGSVTGSKGLPPDEFGFDVLSAQNAGEDLDAIAFEQRLDLCIENIRSLLGEVEAVQATLKRHGVQAAVHHTKGSLRNTYNKTRDRLDEVMRAGMAESPTEQGRRARISGDRPRPASLLLSPRSEPPPRIEVRMERSRRELSSRSPKSSSPADLHSFDMQLDLMREAEGRILRIGSVDSGRVSAVENDDIRQLYEERLKKKLELERLKNRIEREEAESEGLLERREREERAMDEYAATEFRGTPKGRRYSVQRENRDLGVIPLADQRSHSASEVELSYRHILSPWAEVTRDEEDRTRGLHKVLDEGSHPLSPRVEREREVVDDDVDDLLRAWTTIYDDDDDY
jgi:hypothetical protein